MKPYPEIDETYTALVPKLAATGIQYLHVVDHSAMGAPTVPESLKRSLRAAWPRTFILAGGFDRTGAAAEERHEEDSAQPGSQSRSRRDWLRSG
jgi:N-ethylmaleimide reductase